MLNPKRLCVGSKIVTKNGSVRYLIAYTALMPSDEEGYAFINENFFVTTKFYPSIDELLESVPAIKECLGKEYQEN